MPEGWVTDRDPHFEELNVWDEALVTTTDHLIKIGVWNGSEWEVSGGWCASTKVIAWRPLPEPYMEDGR